ncbi:MAG: hypothetical protein AB1801_02430 [Chloroflexota bacterium]
MKKFLKIMAIVLFVVGLALVAVAALQYVNVVSPRAKSADNLMQSLEKAYPEKDAYEIKQVSSLLRTYLDNEAEAKRTFIMLAAGSVVSIIVGVVLWFVSRRKTGVTKKGTAPGSGQALET